MYEHRQLHHPPTVILGETTWRKDHRRFGMLEEDRLRHLWVLGRTGSGKSTLLANIIGQDLAAGRGVAVLDPHGSLVAEVAPQIPRSRTHEVLLLDPTDTAYPVSFNVFRQGSAASSALLCSQLLSVFRRQWSESWGPRLEHILRNAILAIAADQRATLLFLYRFLTDQRLRDQVVAKVQDPVVRHFWNTEFPGYGRGLQAEALSPVLNKLGAYVASPVVRNLLGQERSRVGLGKLLARQGVLLANLATGLIGEDASRLLGGLLLTGLQLAAMGRPPGAPPCLLYVDEFQNFVNDSLATLLAESRKFGLGLVLSHQYLAQLPPALAEAVRGNVGSAIVFRLGADDAVALAPEFSPPFRAADLMELGRYEVVVRLLVRGQALRAFSARTLPPTLLPGNAARRLAATRAQSRMRYARARHEVERAVARTMT